jgi:hypothetical protein
VPFQYSKFGPAIQKGKISGATKLIFSKQKRVDERTKVSNYGKEYKEISKK